MPHPAPLRWIVERSDGESVPVGLGPRRERGVKRNSWRCRRRRRRRSPCKRHNLNVAAHAIQRKDELRKFFGDGFKAARIRGIPRMGQTFAGNCWLVDVSNGCVDLLLLLLVRGKGLCGEAVDLRHHAGRVHALVGAAASLDHDSGRIHVSVESGQVRLQHALHGSHKTCSFWFVVAAALLALGTASYFGVVVGWWWCRRGVVSAVVGPAPTRKVTSIVADL